MTWPWRRRRQGAVLAERADSAGSTGSLPSNGAPAGAGPSKAGGQASQQGPAQQLVAVLVMQPDDAAMVGVTHVPAQPGAAAAAPPRPRSSDSDSSTGSGRSSRRSSNDVGAAYLAELEEREASRREMSRRNAGLAGTPAGAWGLGFFPSYII